MSFQDWGNEGGYGRSNPPRSFDGGYGSSSSYQQSNQPTLFNSPSDYDNNFQAVADNIRQMSTNINQIKQIANLIGTSKDGIDQRERMHTLIENTRTLVKDTAQDLKTLDTSDSKKRNLQQKLMKEFQSAIQRFQEINKISVEKERANPLAPPKPNQRNSNHDMGYQSRPNQSLIDMDMESQAAMEQSRNQQMQFQNEMDFNDSIIASREEGIREIERTVIEVNEIFRDLSHLVVEQGQMIDNIESNIEDASASTDVGVQEIRKASDYQKKARTKMCCLALIIAAILAALVIVIYIFAR